MEMQESLEGYPDFLDPWDHSEYLGKGKFAYNCGEDDEKRDTTI
jgi:hypothetical protein